ncbi:MAG: sulfatase [Chitinophagaceae bacterium]|nr:sulfatase [Chitinophagaceae bacterium]
MINYRKIIVVIPAWVVLITTLTSYSQQNLAGRDANRPNIIFLLTDDQRWDALGAAGNTIIQTPHLDQLARSGILFQNAYTTTAICCVSRAGILTGQYEAYHNIHDFSTDLSPEALSRTYPVLLKNAGYQIGFIGKFGIGKNPPESVFDFWMDTEAGGKGQPDYMITGKDGNLIHDTDTINNAIQSFLDQFGKRDQPFYLSVSFKAPHEQDGFPPRYIIQPRYKEYYKYAAIPEPVTAAPEYWEQLPGFFRTDTNFARARWKGLFGTPELFRENVKNYYRLITGVDDVVGNIVSKLKETGIDRNTIIIFMGDNGMFLGEHGMEGKWYGYEESIRVPMLIYDPDLPDKIRQYKAPQIALNIDIAPTILGMAGIKPPGEMQGIDLIRMLKNEIPEREDFFYQHYFLGGSRIPQVEGVVTKRFKYMNYIEHDYEELYDIRYDPHETTNLAGDAGFKKELAVLRRRYQAMCKVYAVPGQRKKKSYK